MSKRILCVGGSGYIGSHTVKYLAQKGYRAGVFDLKFPTLLLQNSWVGAEDFYTLSVLVQKDLEFALQDFKPDAVIHFAAKAYVSESVKDPAEYYRTNVVGSLNLMDAMLETRCKNLIFSSSCAVYGNPETLPIVEGDETFPVSPYGQTKLTIEKALHEYDAAYGFPFVSLRYFNAAGADPEGELGEDHDPETHVIPLAIRAALDGTEFKIYGNDFLTHDGTCLRDFVHVTDLARAHYLAVEDILSKEPKSLQNSYNLGSAKPYSVADIITKVEEVTGKPIKAEIVERRVGDPDELWCNYEAAERDFGWKPEHDLTSIVETAYKWEVKRRAGAA